MVFTETLAWLTLAVGVPLNAFATYLLYRKYREAPTLRVLKERFIASAITTLVVLFFGIIFVNNDQLVPPLGLDTTKWITRLAMLALALIPAAGWIMLYRNTRPTDNHHRYSTRGEVMQMTVYWQIFWRTFAQLALAVVIAAQGYEWTQGNARVNVSLLGFGLLGAFLGALVAALYALAKSPATTPLGKAIRSAVQALAGGIGAVAVNSVADVVDLEKLAVPLAVAVVLAFAVTYFQWQPAPDN